MSATPKKIGRGLKSFGQFIAALGATNKRKPPPDPRKAIAQNLRDATKMVDTELNHRIVGGAASSEEVLGKAISDGYKEQRR